MHTDVKAENPIPDGSAMLLVPIEDWLEHTKRVESLCNLLEKLFGALANNPMFQAMIPPDVLAELRNK